MGNYCISHLIKPLDLEGTLPKSVTNFDEDYFSYIKKGKIKLPLEMYTLEDLEGNYSFWLN